MDGGAPVKRRGKEGGLDKLSHLGFGSGNGSETERKVGSNGQSEMGSDGI